jgi:hypothetical protein
MKMKKLLSVVLVLGFVSLANAVIYSPMQVVSTGGGTVGIELISGMSSAVDNSGGYWALIGVDPDSGIIAPPSSLDLSGLCGSSTQIGLDDGVIGGFVSSSMSSWSTPAGVYATGFTVLPGVTHLELWQLDDGYGPIQIVWSVPEPATIALLCLGGLMLRRKK